jgi:uncharacterized membrane protein YkvA (DUF1232 family)
MENHDDLVHTRVDPAMASRDERIVRTGFRAKLRANLHRIPFLDEVLAAYFCAVDPATPARVKGVLLAALAYFVLPVDAMPDFMAVLGFTDDATVLLAAMRAVQGHVRPEHRERARVALSSGLEAEPGG